MHRIDSASNVITLPQPKPQGTPGFFQPGVHGGVEATIVEADWLNTVQEEISHVVEQAGLTPSKTDNTQLLQAIRIHSGATGGFLPLTGGTLSGTLAFSGGNGIRYNGSGNFISFGWDGSEQVTASVDGTASPGALANRSYVDATFLPLTGGTLTNPGTLAVNGVLNANNNLICGGAMVVDGGITARAPGIDVIGNVVISTANGALAYVDGVPGGVWHNPSDLLLGRVDVNQGANNVAFMDIGLVLGTVIVTAGNFEVTVGNGYKSTGPEWATLLDIRHQRSDRAVRSFDRGLAEITALQPVIITGGGDQPTYALLPDEAEAVMPEMIGEVTLERAGQQETVATMDYNPVYFALVNAIKELAAKVEALEARR